MESSRRLEMGDDFRAAGLRPTSQRRAILEFLSRKPVHVTAAEILRAVNRTDPQASRATVYNSLKSLARAGLAREVTPAGGAARFEAGALPHHHFLCQRCGALDDIEWFDLPAGSGRAALRGREVRGYEIVFHGVCGECARKGKRRGES